MDKLRLLQVRKQKILSVGKEIRKDIDSLIDKDSFVELSSFSFSKNDFYGEEAEGEGVGLPPPETILFILSRKTALFFPVE